jgi:hypothetical protein
MRSTATFTRPASATTYSVSDSIANSGTGSAVTPLTFKMGVPRGLLISATCVVTPASGNLVIANLDFDLLLFRPDTDTPFAAGSYPADNAALAVTPAAFRNLVAVINFNSSNWRNPAGLLTAGAAGWQASVPSVQPMIEFHTLDLNTLIGVVQVKGAWDPGNVANQFDFVLETSYE